MSFTLPDLLIEGAIRAGYELLRTSTVELRGQILDVVFDFEQSAVGKDGGLPESIVRKYTQERARLIDFFTENEVAIVQSFSDVQSRLPCVSIQLANDGEDQGLALADDFGGVNGETLGPDQNIIHANTTINVGIHTKEQLLTKYLYHLTKYFILSSKLDLIRQNFIIATFRGSDFSRDASWQGDHVYTRFLNISGKTEDSWIDLDEVLAGIEQVDINVYVPTPPTDDGGVVFSNPASQATDPLMNGGYIIGDTTIMVANSFYLGDPGDPITILTRAADFTIISQEVVEIVTNDISTGTLTITPALTLDHPIDIANGITTYVLQGDLSTQLAQSQTVQSRPVILSTTTDTEFNNDDETLEVVHRTTRSTT